MPYRPSLDASFDYASVVDEELRVAGHPHLYVCDMSVMPIRTAASPVQTLVALALRLSNPLESAIRPCQCTGGDLPRANRWSASTGLYVESPE